jgi:glycosyltransferase involved in cell wall biosynthesis
MRNRRLLLVSYVFPPAGGITVQRAVSLAKYLPRCGYDVHVLTARNPAAPVSDPGLLEHIPDQVRVHRAFTPELPFYVRKKLWDRVSSGSQGPAAPSPARWKSSLRGMVQKVFCPDPQVVWAPFAIRRAARIIQEHRIEVVVVTAPPFSVFRIGNALKRRFPYLKLVSDFRDEWLRFYLTDFEFLSNGHVQRRAEAMEQETVELSDLVVAVTRSSLEEIRGRYPRQPAGKFAHVSNGYDPEVFAGFQPHWHGQPKIVVTHLGTAYKTASPRFYLEAMEALPDALRSQFETRFIGRIAETERAVLEGRRSAVRLLGFLPQTEAVRQVEETDFLLLTMTNDFSLPGKLFEYLAMGKPILALSPPGGEVARLLQETGAGWCVDPQDRPAIQAMLVRACEQVQQGRLQLWPQALQIKRYERQSLTREFDNCIRNLFRASAASAA